MSANPLSILPMGVYHRAESCELVGLYMLNKIAKFVPAQNVGLYRDDGLMVIKKQNNKNQDRKLRNSKRNCINLRMTSVLE